MIVSTRNLAVEPRSRIVADNVRRLRQMRGWSVAQLAAECHRAGAWNLTSEALTYIDRRAGVRVTVDDAFTLAMVLGTTVDRLLTATACDTCSGCPPAGYTCNRCGAGETS